MAFKTRSGSEGTLNQAGDAYPVIISATAPTISTFPDLIVGQLWLDTTGPTLKRCTNASTPTYTSTEGSGGANTALSNLASVAINLPLLPDAAAADDFGSATLPFKDIFLAGSSGTPGTNNFKVTGASTSGTRVITLPNASDTLVGKDTTDTMTNKTLTSPTMTAPALGTPASGVMTNVTGLTEAGQTLADNTTNDVSTTKHGYAPKAPNDTTKFLRGDATWAVPAGGGATTVDLSTCFETAGSFSSAVSNSGAATFGGGVSLTMTTGATATSHTKIRKPTIGGGDFENNLDLEWGYIGWAVTNGTDFDMFVGCSSSLTATGSAITYTGQHMGFRRQRAASGAIGTSVTNGDGTTQTETTSTTAFAGKPALAKKTGSTNIKFYVGTILDATHTTNLPTSMTNYLDLIITNKDVATTTTFDSDFVSAKMVAV